LRRLPETLPPWPRSLRFGITSLRGIAMALNNRGIRAAPGGTSQVSNCAT
jgi:hypothetical protein